MLFYQIFEKAVAATCFVKLDVTITNPHVAVYECSVQVLLLAMSHKSHNSKTTSTRNRLGISK